MRITSQTLLFAVAMQVMPGFVFSQEVVIGQQLYQRYCVNCHGADATGHGPMRPVLVVQPADLTALSQNNSGKFPLERVVKRIDGRDILLSHGSPMPVYGDFFESDRGIAIKTDGGQPVMTSQPVADLVAYIKTLQAD